MLHPLLMLRLLYYIYVMRAKLIVRYCPLCSLYQTVHTHPRLAPGVSSCFSASTNGIMPDTSYHPPETDWDPSFTPRILLVSVIWSTKGRTYKVVPSGYASFLGVCQIISFEVVFFTISTGYLVSLHKRLEGRAYVVYCLLGPLGDIVDLPAISITPLPF